LAAVEEKVLGKMKTLCGVPLCWGREEGQLLSGGSCLGVHGKPGLPRRDEGESVHLVVRQWGLLSSLTQSTGTGAAGQLSDHFLLSKSKSFPKKAGASEQTVLLREIL